MPLEALRASAGISGSRFCECGMQDSSPQDSSPNNMEVITSLCLKCYPMLNVLKIQIRGEEAFPRDRDRFPQINGNELD
jgi:hypothetical protein